MKAPKGFVEYNEADLRFTGWEHECIIIDRTENHYFIPVKRYNELRKRESIPSKHFIVPKGSGIAGYSGVTGKTLN